MNGTPVCIEFEGDQGLRSAGDTAGRLLDALRNNDSVIADCDKITSIDLSFIQTILSARKYAVAAQKSFSLKRGARGPLLEGLQAAGLVGTFFTDADRSAEQKFWTNGAEA